MDKDSEQNLIHINEQLLIKVATLEGQVKKLKQGKTVFIVKEWSYGVDGKLVYKDSLEPYESMVSKPLDT